MQVALHRQVHTGPVGTAGDDDGALQRQRQHLFQHTRHALQVGPRRCQLGTGADTHLPLAVVAHAGSLQNPRQQIIGHGGQLRFGLDNSVRCHRHAAFQKVRLFLCTVLGNGYCRRSRCHEPRFSQFRQGSCRHILEFGGNGARHLRQLRQSLGIGITGADVVVAHTAGGAHGVGIEHSGEIPQALGRMHKHAPELAATHHAQRGLTGGRNKSLGLAHRGLPVTGRVMLRAVWVWSRR